MKRHNPDSICGAVNIVKMALTVEGAAQAIGKSTALIYKFSDASAVPNIHQCVSLDIAYEQQTGLPGPIMRAAKFKIAEAQAIQTEAYCLNENVLKLAEELGAFAREIRTAWADKRITPAEQAELLIGLFRIETVAHITRENVNALAEQSAPSKSPQYDWVRH